MGAMLIKEFVLVHQEAIVLITCGHKKLDSL